MKKEREHTAVLQGANRPDSGDESRRDREGCGNKISSCRFQQEIVPGYATLQLRISACWCPSTQRLQCRRSGISLSSGCPENLGRALSWFESNQYDMIAGMPPLD